MKRSAHSLGAAAILLASCASSPAPRTPAQDACGDQHPTLSPAELTQRCNAGGDLRCLYGARVVGTVTSVVDCPQGRRLVLRASAGSDLVGAVVVQPGKDERGPQLVDAKVGDTVRIIVNDYPIVKRDKTLLDPKIPHSFSRDDRPTP